MSISIWESNQETWFGLKCKLNGAQSELYCHFYFEMLFCGETHTSLSILIREISKAAKLLAAASTKIANILWNIDDTKKKKKKNNGTKKKIKTHRNNLSRIFISTDYFDFGSQQETWIITTERNKITENVKHTPLS